MVETDIVTAPEAEMAASLATMGSRGTREFIRYFSASALALGVDVGGLYVLTSMAGVPYLLSGAISYTAGLLLVYLLSIMWVFDRRTMHHPLVEFSLFAGICLVGLVLNEIVLWLLTGFFGVYYLLSKAASVILVFSWNFFVRKYVLFR